MVVLAFVVVTHRRDVYVCCIGARIAAVDVFRVVVSHCIIWRAEGEIEYTRDGKMKGRKQETACLSSERTGSSAVPEAGWLAVAASRVIAGSSVQQSGYG